MSAWTTHHREQPRLTVATLPPIDVTFVPTLEITEVASPPTLVISDMTDVTPLTISENCAEAKSAGVRSKRRESRILTGELGNEMRIRNHRTDVSRCIYGTIVCVTKERSTADLQSIIYGCRRLLLLVHQDRDMLLGFPKPRHTRSIRVASLSVDGLLG